MSNQKTDPAEIPMIQFKTQLYKIGTWTILRLPESASAKLPSRGQVMVEGTINGLEFRSPLEPDGRWSHWLRLDKDLARAAKTAAGDTVEVAVRPIKEWPEPEIPTDLKKVLAAHPKAHDLWQHITPMARWEWMRWVRSTNRQETRERRLEVACSKLESGERRPCCWNRNACSEPYVSKSGQLILPS